MTTLQTVVDLARTDLNDSGKVRWTDPTLLQFVNDGIQYLIIKRPDLFIGSFASLPSASLVLTDTFPLSDRYKRPMADFVIARANMIDTEAGAESRAGAYMQLAQGGV